MMTKESDKGLRVSRNGDNEKEKSAPSLTKELAKEEKDTSTSSSGVTLKLTEKSVRTTSSSPEKENNKNYSSSSLGGESSTKEKNNKYSSTSLSPCSIGGQQEQSSREQENNKKNISAEGDKVNRNLKTSPSIQQALLGGQDQGPSSSSGRQIRIGSASSDRSRISIDISATGEPMGLPSEQLLVPSHPSTNGNDTAGIKNGLKRQNSGRQKCRCWCCCCSCSCLALRNNEPKSKDAESDLICDADPPPTLAEIQGWGDSFDHLMRSSGGRKVFRDFLKCEYSEENILFWLACEELKKESKPEVIEEKARLIYEDYISILSPKEVSLDSRVRDLVNQNMRNPKPSTFDEAQLQIYTLMHRDSYPRFVNSALYKKLAQLNSSETPTGTTTISALGGGTSHRGSTVSATSPASRKQSAAS